MAFDHARHEEFAGRIQALGAVGCNILGLRSDGCDALAVDQHLAGKRLGAGAIPHHRPVDQKAHCFLRPEVVCSAPLRGV